MPQDPHHRHLLFLVRRLGLLSVAVLIAIFGGAAVFLSIDSDPAHPVTYVDAVYNVVMIITAIGGDKPNTTAGKAFMCVLALISVGILVSVLAQIFRFISARSFHDIAMRIHDRKVQRMPDHIIICGTSFTLHELLRQLPHRDNFWIIVRSEEQALRLEHDGVHAHVEDFTREETLRHAGIDTARCIIACGEDDAESAFVCLSAKHLRKDIPVIVRLSRSENREKLKAAGADEIINPAELAAAQMRTTLDAIRGSRSAS